MIFDIGYDKVYLNGGDYMKQSNQKLKLLYLLKILSEKTDEEHTMTVPQMIEELSKYGVSAERKSIYDDLECLRLYGIDLCVQKSKTYDYFIASRDFELPELKLLVDSVQASKFITKKKSLELISKIEKLTSHENAKKLQRQVFVTNRVKTFNEKIYYNVDKIHEAIAQNKQITFKYFEYNVSKEKVYRKDGNLYNESPVSLTWDDENYYLITYKEKYQSYTHYRVDKMENICVSDRDRILPDKEFDLSDYSKTVFGMFGGEKTDVSIKFTNDLAGVVFDHFGTKVPVIKLDDNCFKCNVKVAISNQFLSWVMGFGNKAKILSPESVVNQMKSLVEDIKNIYN